VIEADDLEPAVPGVPPPVDVIFRVDHEARLLLLRDVVCSDNVANLGVVPEQQPTALSRRRLPRVRDNRVDRSATDAHA
jgi:hypothetical protein